MTEAAQTIENPGDAMMSLWRRLRPNPDNKRYYAFVLLMSGAIVLAALVSTLVENTLMDPNVVTEGGAISPDGKWVALTEAIDPGPAMGNFDSAVELRHHDGLLMGPTLERTFLIKFDSSKIELMRVRWYTHNLLEITLRADREDMPKHMTQVGDVLIDYRRLDWK